MSIRVLKVLLFELAFPTMKSLGVFPEKLYNNFFVTNKSAYYYDNKIH